MSWAKSQTAISELDISVIIYARKAVLFRNGTLWMKRSNTSLFDTTMGSYDGAKVFGIKVQSKLITSQLLTVIGLGVEYILSMTCLMMVPFSNWIK
ncbi:hypothetical protein HOLleu_42215 [Holothuria leucospilota]|uniref:Uncharacterized protein n=1 Tax=Holothuria leucospilota TaxID=206669 RepID=A0A9Q1BA91_HOLLE|nr:hypothetical protein HOLleu_42215 [Holothuria leucospilota]